MDQGSSEWIQARTGRFGASCLNDLMAKLKTGKPAASRRDVIVRVATERLTGSAVRQYVSAAMERGTLMEPEARAAYEVRSGAFVEQVGWVPHPNLPFSGASPDGLCDEDGMVELKVPSPVTHLEALLGGENMLEQYRFQCQWQMEVCGRKYNDLVSYCPEMPDHLKLWIRRIERDEEVIAMIRAGIVAANAEVEEMIRALNTA